MFGEVKLVSTISVSIDRDVILHRGSNKDRCHRSSYQRGYVPPWDFSYHDMLAPVYRVSGRCLDMSRLKGYNEVDDTRLVPAGKEDPRLCNFKDSDRSTVDPALFNPLGDFTYYNNVTIDIESGARIASAGAVADMIARALKNTLKDTVADYGHRQ